LNTRNTDANAFRYNGSSKRRSEFEGAVATLTPRAKTPRASAPALKYDSCVSHLLGYPYNCVRRIRGWEHNSKVTGRRRLVRTKIQDSHGFI